jgi:hypothetical protein
MTFPPIGFFRQFHWRGSNPQRNMRMSLPAVIEKNGKI